MNMAITGLKCDNPDCNWRNDDIRFEEYGEWLNRPCPMCGSNLLTKEDYDAVNRLMRFANSKPVQLIDKVAGIFSKKHYHFDLGMDGTGRIRINNKRESEE